MGLMTQMILEIPAPAAVVVELAQTALQELPATIERIDADQGLILAKRGLSLSTYGQVLRVWIVPEETGGAGGVRLTLQSELVAGFQVIDWGKNDANLRDFARNLTVLLEARGYGAATLVSDSSATPRPADAPPEAVPPSGTPTPVGPNPEGPRASDASGALAPAPAIPSAPAQPADFFRRPPKDRMIAVILEISFGLGGIAGVGWMYGGNMNTGLVLLLGVLAWDCLVAAIAAFTGGLSCLCTVPINLGVAAFSAARLNAFARAHPETFSG